MAEAIITSDRAQPMGKPSSTIAAAAGRAAPRPANPAVAALLDFIAREIADDYLRGKQKTDQSEQAARTRPQGSLRRKAMKAAIYARYSTDQQRTESIADQVDSCRKYAANAGLTVIDSRIFADQAMSGTRKDRPALEKLVEAAERNEFEALLVDDLSRLARDNHLMLTLMAKMHSHGIKVVSVADQLDSGNDEANLGIQIRGIFNEMQIQDLRKKTLRGLIGQKQRGFSAGEKVFGYKSVPVGELKIDKNGNRRPDGYAFEIDPEQAKVVLRIFREYAAGNSVYSMVQSLNEQKVPGYRGQAGTWSSGSIHRILENEKYIGRWIWNRTGNRRDPYSGRRRIVAKPESKWIVREDEGLRIVPQQLWEQVAGVRSQARRVWPGRNGRKSRKCASGAQQNSPYATHLLSGILACHACGGWMSLVSGKQGGYYGCLAAAKNACSNRRLVRRQIVEERLIAAVSEQLSSPENISYVLQQVAKQIKKSGAGAPKQLAAKKPRTGQAEQEACQSGRVRRRGQGKRGAAAGDRGGRRADRKDRAGNGGAAHPGCRRAGTAQCRLDSRSPGKPAGGAGEEDLGSIPAAAGGAGKGCHALLQAGKGPGTLCGRGWLLRGRRAVRAAGGRRQQRC